MVGQMQTIDMHIGIAIDIGHTGTTEDTTVNIAATQGHRRVTHQVGLLTATIHFLEDITTGNGHTAVAEDIG